MIGLGETSGNRWVHVHARRRGARTEAHYASAGHVVGDWLGLHS
jgi:hypothetical protein